MAAVCYRVRGTAIEFLLVQTRGGRWIFPKGSAEPGLTPAQAAALEAFEEAGVHGRIEEASFARYVRRKGGGSGDSGSVEINVKAYLCQVLSLEQPQELDRQPTWFSAEKAKRRLRNDRAVITGMSWRASWKAPLPASSGLIRERARLWIHCRRFNSSTAGAVSQGRPSANKSARLCLLEVIPTLSAGRLIRRLCIPCCCNQPLQRRGYH